MWRMFVSGVPMLGVTAQNSQGWLGYFIYLLKKSFNAQPLQAAVLIFCSPWITSNFIFSGSEGILEAPMF